MVVDTSTYDIKKQCDLEILHELQIDPEYCVIKFKKNLLKLEAFLDENCPNWTENPYLTYRDPAAVKRWLLYTHIKKRLQHIQITATDPYKKFKILLFKEHMYRQLSFESPKSPKYLDIVLKIFKNKNSTVRYKISEK